MRRRLLITGGCGYVGRELVARAVHGWDVHVMDNLRSGRHRLDTMPRDRFTLHEVDIRDRTRVHDVMAAIQPNVVVHLAAIHFIPACESDPQLAIETNVSGTVNLLEATPKHTRFINTSSAAVYAPVDGPLGESTTPTGPMDIYGWTKLHAEQLVTYFANRGQFTGWTVRLFNVIGPGETNPHLVPEMVYQLKQGVTSLCVGNISPRRDFIDVSDVAEGFLRLVHAPAEALPRHGSEAVLNLGTGRTHAVADILEHLKLVSGITFVIKSDPARVRVVDRPVLMAATHKLQSVLDWTPTRSLSETVGDLWRESIEELRHAVACREA